MAGLSRKSNMDICSYPNGSGVNHVVIDLTLFLCACYNANMLPTYPYGTCWLNIVSTSAETIFGRVADMSADMLATCQADTHVSVDSTIFLTFKNPTFPAKMANGQTLRRAAQNVARGVRTKKCGCADGLVVQNLHR